MARRADWDMADDDFEIIDEFIPVTLPLKASHASHVEVSYPPLVNSNPITNGVTPSLEKPPLSTTLHNLPIRYGSAAGIPHEEGFDLKSVMNCKPIIPPNDLLTFIHDNRSSKQSVFDNSLSELLIEHTRARENLFEMARKTQQDFISAMNLD